MAVAARKLDHGHPVVKRPALRLVTASPAPGGRARSRTRTKRSPLVFQICCAAMVVLACVGLLRIALAVQAAEDAIDTMELQASIKAEELASKSLEANRSALQSPSRIQALADGTLNMTKAGSVRYITLADEEAKPGSAEGAKDSGVLAAAMSTVMDLAAGEAQVLLVGDMGLATGR
ncbi:MAG: hypothetical protein WBI63_08860 [Coriobacteriia bacterium]